MREGKSDEWMDGLEFLREEVCLLLPKLGCWRPLELHQYYGSDSEVLNTRERRREEILD